MIDINKQIAYWQDGAKEDWEIAHHLIERGNTRHGLFFAHLALEKVLKAHVCRHTGDLAPRIHNLVRLAELAALTTDQAQIDFLADMNKFNVEGRYLELLPLPPKQAVAQQYLTRAEEMFQWLMNQL